MIRPDSPCAAEHRAPAVHYTVRVCPCDAGGWALFVDDLGVSARSPHVFDIEPVIRRALSRHTGLPAERFRIDWHYTAEPRPGGVIRNQVLDDQGADVCLAFPPGRSPGTRDCMRRAATAGIPVLDFGEGPR